jgi:hypothetical protein
MKKAIPPPVLNRRMSDKDSKRTSQSRSRGVSVRHYDLKKAVLPRSLDLMFTLRYRR